MAMARRPFRLWRHDCEGTAAVEFALLAPVLVGILVAMIDLGIGITDKLEVESAAAAGVQYAVANGWNSAGIAAAVTGSGSLITIAATPAPSESCGCPGSSGISAAGCGSVCPDGSTAGVYVTVGAQASYAPMLPYPGLANPTLLAAQAMVRIR